MKLEFNQQEAINSADDNYFEEKIAVAIEKKGTFTLSSLSGM